MMFVTFYDLSEALAPLHLWEPAQVADLHDIWLKGAPSPNSRILTPNHYDPRENQKKQGNLEKRLILPSQLVVWIVGISIKRGFPISEAQALAIANGEARYTW